MKISIQTDSGSYLLPYVSLDSEFAEKVRSLKRTTQLDEVDQELFDLVVNVVASVMPEGTTFDELRKRITACEGDTLNGLMTTNSEEFGDALQTISAVLVRDPVCLRIFKQMIQDDMDEDRADPTDEDK